MSPCFFQREYISRGGSQVLQNFEGVALKGGSDRFRIFWGVVVGWGRAGLKGVRSVFQGGADTLEETMTEWNFVYLVIFILVRKVLLLMTASDRISIII